MYGSWDMEHNRLNFLSFWAFFCLFTSLMIKKIKIWKMKKPPGDVTILHKCTQNHDHMLYFSWDMARNRYNFYFSLLAFFALLHP